ncbi:hypothetical protein AR505_1259 [methanogenic archaeon ISO4-H5]|nr:hypothetical protein AR505_1259 [methanogenic archaeon ISO4-H5]
MVIDPEVYRLINKRKDDPIFMDFLLNHYSQIVDSKEGMDKICYAQEIARVLARFAIQERVLAEHSDHPIDEEKYNRYYRTALYIIRKGIDIGMKMDYEANVIGGKPLNVSYNYHMGWAYVQYSMILAENYRYFAAMGAIVTAENYLVNDIYKIKAGNRLQGAIDLIKSLPDYDASTHGPLTDLTPEQADRRILHLFDSLGEAVNEKKLRILDEVYKKVPDKYRFMYAVCIDGLLDYFKKRNEKDFLKNYGKVVLDIQEEFPEIPKKFLDLPDLSQKNLAHDETQEEKNYALWIDGCHLFLSYLDFVPDIEKRLRYECDDLVFDFQIPDLNNIMEDVVETYSHCRFQFYMATQFNSPIEKLAYSFSPFNKRIYNQELLLDTYPRLYSILDKISHIVMKICDITIMPNDDGYTPQPSYNLIVQEIRKNSNGNPYLLTLCEIFDEINPRYIYRTQKDVPFYTMLPGAEHMDRIRHHIIHSGIMLDADRKVKKSNKIVCHISGTDFAMRCLNLITLVKEAIMNTCMAIEYRNRQE